MSCFMSTSSDRLPIPSYHRVEFLSLRRFLLSRVVALFDKQSQPDSRASVDVTITAFMLTMISTSDPSLEGSVPHWVSVLKFKMQQLQIIMHDFHGSVEDVEEYRRYVPPHIYNAGQEKVLMQRSPQVMLGDVYHGPSLCLLFQLKTSATGT